jgi:hypothetical protein
MGANHQLLMSHGGASAPTTDPDFASVVWLSHFEGTNGQTTTVDSSSYARTITRGSTAALSNVQKPFGVTSALFGVGTGHFWSVANATEMQMGTSQFTIECFAYITNGGASPYSIYNKGINTGGGMLLGCSGTNAVIRVNGTSDTTFGPFTSIQNAWTHIAFVRDASDVIRFYSAGVQIGSATISFNNNDTSVAAIGQNINPAFAASGYFKEFRVTKGVCRYPNGTTFTPPSAAFPDS